MELIVRKKWQEADGIVGFELVDSRDSELPAFSAGSHIDVEAAPGITRQYSLCNSPEERNRYVIGVLRDPKSRGGSIAMHERVQEGNRIKISLPRNQFSLDLEAAHVALIAGGIGVTPLLSMARQLDKLGKSFELHYCTRSERQTAFRNTLASANMARVTSIYFDDQPDMARFDITNLLIKLPRATHIYLCGPGGFMEYVTNATKAANWPTGQIHREYFAPKPPNDQASSGSFELELARSHKVLIVPSDKRVIDVLQAAGVSIPVSCEQGICGTCLTRVIDGIPDHRDSYLTDEEHARNDQFTPCCSRCAGDKLTIDL